MSNFFHIIVSQPLYNGFVFLIDLLPFFDAGVVVVIFTVVVKIVLLPVSIKASKSQLEMKKAEPDLNSIREKYKDNKEERAKKELEYYKEKNINPFGGIFLLFIQLPILIGLYRVFIKSGLPIINKEMLYSFVSVPESVNMVFLHLIDISHKSIVLAAIAGLTTYLQIQLASAPTSTQEASSQSELQKAMSVQMKYMLPVLMTVIGYTVSSAVSLYLITSNVFSVAQEYYIRKRYHKHTLVV